MTFNARNVVHHGVEAIAFIGIGTYALSSPASAVLAYTAGKLAYISTKRMLEKLPVSEFLKDNRRNISWTLALLMGGSTTYFAMERIENRSMDILHTIGIILGVTSASIGIRVLADKVVKYLGPEKVKTT